MRAAAFAAAMLATLAAAGPARADDRSSALDAPAPPTLPALAHAKLTDTFEITGASIDPGHGHGRAYAWFLHDELEYPLVPRVFYVGAAHDVVSGAVPGSGRDFFFGAPEIWTRGLWSSVVGLSSGGGFGVVVPAPRDLSKDAREVFENVRVVRPWDAAYFTDRVVTLRPWIDIRHVVWRFVFQLRQGLDIGIVARDLRGGERRVDYTARTTFYVGFRVAEPLGIGLEVWEVYQISADLPDDKRAAVSVSPSVRLSLGRVEPALSLLFPIATPLRGEAASYFGARFNVGFEFDVAGTGRARGDSKP
jgi:hypothetical protein